MPRFRLRSKLLMLWQKKNMTPAATTLKEVFYTAWNPSKLDACGRRKLLAMLSNNASPEEQRIANRILQDVRCGRVEVVV